MSEALEDGCGLVNRSFATRRGGKVTVVVIPKLVIKNTVEPVKCDHRECYQSVNVIKLRQIDKFGHHT
jgi:hypothetical protein